MSDAERTRLLHLLAVAIARRDHVAEVLLRQRLDPRPVAPPVGTVEDLLAQACQGVL